MSSQSLIGWKSASSISTATSVPGLRVLNLDLWVVAEIRRMSGPRWRRRLESGVCRRSELVTCAIVWESLSVECWLVSSVSNPLQVLSQKGSPLQGVLASNVCPIRKPNCFSLFHSEDLIPVGGSLVVCSLCQAVQGYFCLSPSGTVFYLSDLPAYFLVVIHLIATVWATWSLILFVRFNACWVCSDRRIEGKNWSWSWIVAKKKGIWKIDE